jgi:hypothetical protein
VPIVCEKLLRLSVASTLDRWSRDPMDLGAIQMPPAGQKDNSAAEIDRQRHSHAVVTATGEGGVNSDPRHPGRPHAGGQSAFQLEMQP